MFDLAIYTPFLVNRVGTRIAAAFSRRLEPFGITLQMWRVLAALWHDGDQSIGQLVSVTAIEQWTMSRLAAAMERKGLVSRTRSGEDGRVVTVALTAEGRRMAEAIIPLAEETETVVLKGLSAGDIAVLRNTLGRIYANAGDLEPGGAAEREPSRPRPNSRSGPP